VDASTDFGKVSCDLPVRGREGAGSRLKGALGGGGRRLRLHSSSGAVVIGPLDG
jgi:hypothetical protein